MYAVHARCISTAFSHSMSVKTAINHSVKCRPHVADHQGVYISLGAMRPPLALRPKLPIFSGCLPGVVVLTILLLGQPVGMPFDSVALLCPERLLCRKANADIYSMPQGRSSIFSSYPLANFSALNSHLVNKVDLHKDAFYPDPLPCSTCMYRSSSGCLVHFLGCHFNGDWCGDAPSGGGKLPRPRHRYLLLRW